MGGAVQNYSFLLWTGPVLNVSSLVQKGFLTGSIQALAVSVWGWCGPLPLTNAGCVSAVLL